MLKSRIASRSYEEEAQELSREVTALMVKIGKHDFSSAKSQPERATAQALIDNIRRLVRTSMDATREGQEEIDIARGIIKPKGGGRSSD